MKKEKLQKKAKFYSVMTKVLKESAILIPLASIFVGAALIPTVSLAAGLISAFAGCAFGAGCYVSSNIAKVYADGYSAELAIMNEATVEDFKVEENEKVATQTNAVTYENTNQNVNQNTNEDEFTK